MFINALRAVLRLEPIEPEPDLRILRTRPEDDGNHSVDKERNDV